MVFRWLQHNSSQLHRQRQEWDSLVKCHIHALYSTRLTRYRAGLANLFWWVDREKGVAGMIGTQILPFGDAEVAGLWVGAETAIYQALADA